MIFTELANYAERSGLVTEPGFVTRTIHWLIDLAEDGSVQGISRSAELPPFAYCPQLQQPGLVRLPRHLRSFGFSVRAAAQFLIDRCSTVTNWAINPSEELKVSAKHQAFAALVELASREIAVLEPINAFLSREFDLRNVRLKLRELKALPNDQVSLSIRGVPYVTLEVWRPWWRRFYSEIDQDQRTRKALSLVTGRLVKPVMTHPKISGLGAGARSTGDVFVSFDKEAFRSFGFSKGENAVFAVNEAAAYRAGLAALLPNALDFGHDKIVHWCDQALSEGVDPMRVLFDPRFHNDDTTSRDRLREMFERTARTSSPHALVPDAKVFALTVAGAAGRARIRSWDVTTRHTLIGSVDAWFDDLEIVDVDGMTSAPPQGLQALLLSLHHRVKETKESFENYVESLTVFQRPLFQAAFNRGQELPKSMLGFIVKGIQAAAISADFASGFSNRTGEYESSVLRRLRGQIALLKAYRRRSGDQYIQVSLNPDHPDQAYQCGRLTAQLFRIRHLYRGQGSLTLLHQPFALALTLPANILEPLIFETLHMLEALDASRPSFEQRSLVQLSNVWRNMGHHIPKYFSSEDQAGFILGYYQQLVDDLNSKNQQEKGRSDETD